MSASDVTPLALQKAEEYRGLITVLLEYNGFHGKVRLKPLEILPPPTTRGRDRTVSPMPWKVYIQASFFFLSSV